MSNHAVAAVSAVASKQLGLFTRAQARERHLSDAGLLRLVRAGTIERVSPRVFRFAASGVSWHQSVLAACLDGGPDCLASHRTAAALHGLDGFNVGGVIEVVVPMHVRHRRRETIVHHTRDLGDVDRTRIGVIPTTSLARTLLDLGAVMPATTVEEALDAAERDQRLRRATLERRYAALRAPGRNGIGAMTQILERRETLDRVPWSVLERRMLRLLERAGLPLPVSRFRLRLPDGRIVELDFAFVDMKLGLEVDSHGAHSTRRQRAHDVARANAIADAGWQLRRFTYEQVVHEPRLVTQSVRAALAAANRL
jgi:very-short-patch-repair endonuclease